MNAREALTKLRDWVRLTAAAELFGKDVRPLAWLVGPKDVLTEIDRLLAELPEAEPVTDAEVEAAISEVIGANRIEASYTDENPFPDGFVAGKRKNLVALIARRVAEERVHDAAELRAENARLRLEIGLLESRVPPEPVTDAGSAVVEELLAALGLHPDTGLETVRSHIDSVRAEARCSADARQMGRDEERARAQALADAVEMMCDSERRTAWIPLARNVLAAWKAGGAK